MEEVDKMSHRLRPCGAAAVLLLLLTLLSSCGQSAAQDETATDYNQYIPSHGVTAYTKDLYIFFDSGRLFYVGRSQPSQLFPSLLSSGLRPQKQFLHRLAQYAFKIDLCCRR